MASAERPKRHGRPSLARKARGIMVREQLFPAGSHALVMVSGGQDSLALLHILASGAVSKVGPVCLHALHVNHHLRGGESDEDEALVVRACAAMGVGLTVLHRPVEKRRGNVQEMARDARREAALAVARDRECDRIALGHTADDQAENMLYRLGRYGGLAAFAGMAACDPPWVRPLLDCRRRETAAYCRENGLEFADDSGNAHPGYVRSAIRGSVLPAWETALPGAVKAACRAAEVAGEMQALAAEILETALPTVGLLAAGSRAASSQGGEVEGYGGAEAEELSVAALQRLTPAVRRLLLHRWLEVRARPAASRAAVLAAETLLGVPGSAERALGGGWRVRKEYDRLFLERGSRSRSPVPAAAPLPIPGEAVWGEWVVRAELAERYGEPDVSAEAYLDAGSLDGPLEVRGPMRGDRLRPLGAPGRRKLQDVFVDLRVPASERAYRPLVVCGGRIVWVCGLVLAEEGRISGSTEVLVRLSVGPGPKQDGPGDTAGHGEGGQQ